MTDISPENNKEDDTGVTDASLAFPNATQEENTSLPTTMATLMKTPKALQDQVTNLFCGGSNHSTNTRSNKNNKSY